MKHEKMMENMDSYGNGENPGYHPPKGNAGPRAQGVMSHKKNPMSVPRKGSSIGEGDGNSDRMKAMRNIDEQEKKENLRGKLC